METNTCENLVCNNCKVNLSVPYIRCMQCTSINLCCQCFSNGAEISQHENNHNYSVIKNDFYVYDESDWTANEEILLLDAIIEYGYGNWSQVSQKVRSRSPLECKDHYNQFYIEKPGSKLLPKFPETDASLFPEPVIPYNFRLSTIEDPPRHAPNSYGFGALAGYSAARSDFEYPYDSSAENIFSEIYNCDQNANDCKIVRNLQCGIMRSYNNRLRERQRVMHVMREHGLINSRSQISRLYRLENLEVFVQFMSGIQFDLLSEGLKLESEVKEQIERLEDYRSKGITSLYGIKLHEKLKKKRNKMEKELDTFYTQYSIQNVQSSADDCTFPNIKKRTPAPPLDIVRLPGYDQLSEEERNLCSSVRLIPVSYLEFKNILVTENSKLGSLKLQEARKLIKIDVNKTRKLYDFLVEQNLITKSK